MLPREFIAPTKKPIVNGDEDGRSRAIAKRNPHQEKRQKTANKLANGLYNPSILQEKPCFSHLCEGSALPLS